MIFLKTHWLIGVIMEFLFDGFIRFGIVMQWGLQSYSFLYWVKVENKM